MSLNLEHVGRARDQRSLIRGPRGPGRPPGTPNNINADVREMILKALNHVGGERYLARQAIENPGSFITLLGKILPTHVTSDGTVTHIQLHLLAAQAISDEIIARQQQRATIDAEPVQQKAPSNILDAPPPIE